MWNSDIIFCLLSFKWLWLSVGFHLLQKALCCRAALLHMEKQKKKRSSSELLTVLELVHSYCWPLLDNLDLLTLHFGFRGYKRWGCACFRPRYWSKLDRSTENWTLRQVRHSVLFPSSLKEAYLPCSSGFTWHNWFIWRGGRYVFH